MVMIFDSEKNIRKFDFLILSDILLAFRQSQDFQVQC